MKLPFRNSTQSRRLRQQLPAAIPRMQTSSICARYQAARVGGDFFDFVTTGSGYLVFVLMDISGRREEALDIAFVVQEWFRKQATSRFADGDINENERLTDVIIGLNRRLLEAAGGVRFAPTFLGCYRESVGTLAYINAGQPPAMLKDRDGITMLESTGVPLGLFSHATHDARVTMLLPGASLAIVSRGLLESRVGSNEYGSERLSQFLASRDFRSAEELCSGALESVQHFLEEETRFYRQPVVKNDITIVSLVRAAAAAAAALP